MSALSVLLSSVLTMVQSCPNQQIARSRGEAGGEILVNVGFSKCLRHREGFRLPVVMKSRYMAPDQEGYERQKTFDDALEKLRLFDFDLSRFGPPTGVFTAALASAGYSIDGFTIAARSQ